MKKQLLVLLAVILVAGLILIGCSPAQPTPTPTPTPPVDEVEEWVPPVPGMKQGEEDLYFTWRFAAHYPREIPPAGYDLTYQEWYHKELEKRTDGHIKIEMFYDGVLGKSKEMTKLLAQGVFEMAVAPTLAFPDIFPYSGVLRMPFWMPEDPMMSAMLWDQGWSHPLVLKELTAENIMYGYAVAGQINRLTFAKKVGEITKVEDLVGLQTRSKGYNNKWTEALGMTPVNLQPHEIYEAIQKGMIDASLVSLLDMKNKRLYEVMGSAIDVSVTIGGGGGAPGYVNLDAWNSLPQYIKDIWRELYPEAIAFANEQNLIGLQESLDIAKQSGFEFYKLPPEEEAKYKAAGVVAWEQMVENLEKQPNGKQVREYIKDLIAYREQLTGEKWTVFKP